ncbi:MAG TPA: hypothetical protein VH394_10260 [Thermoanaerobaculia bacterium]|nr:hypothetical protein [Thermoanaerobaculia bacterium]
MRLTRVAGRKALEIVGKLKVLAGLLEFGDGLAQSLVPAHRDKAGPAFEESRAEALQLGAVQQTGSTVLVQQPAKGLRQLALAALNDVPVEVLHFTIREKLRIATNNPLSHGHAVEVYERPAKNLHPCLGEHVLAPPSHWDMDRGSPLWYR